jgi:hypothetical protein
MDHKEMGYRIMERLTKDLAHVGQVDRQPEFEGRFMIMYMSPLPARVQVQKPKAAPATAPSPGKEGDHAQAEDKPIGEETIS